MLSLAKYVWKCVLGTVVVYAACIFYGVTLSGERAELHHELLGLLPFFEWGQPLGMILAGACLALYALLFGWYIVWMHNSSME